MNNLTEVQTFSEDPFIKLKWILFIVSFFLIFATFIISQYGMPNSGKFDNWSAEGFLLMLFCCNVIAVGIAFLAMSFTKKRTVTCDLKECEVYTTNFWNNDFQNQGFKWAAVTDTNLIKEFIGKGGRTAVIEINADHQSIRLFSQNLSKGKDFEALLDLINNSTPQLQYVWEKAPDFGDRQIIVEVLNFTKVSRT
jgi:hypothetical protein